MKVKAARKRRKDRAPGSALTAGAVTNSSSPPDQVAEPGSIALTVVKLMTGRFTADDAERIELGKQEALIEIGVRSERYQRQKRAGEAKHADALTLEIRRRLKLPGEARRPSSKILQDLIDGGLVAETKGGDFSWRRRRDGIKAFSATAFEQRVKRARGEKND